MDWSAEITFALRRIAPHIRRTPTMPLAFAGLPLIESKLEHLQHTGTFKARGAFNSLLANTVPSAGITAASGVNHGAAVAFAAHSLGHKAQIFVPELAGPAKIALIKRTGADLTIVPGTYAEAAIAAEAYAAETGAIQIHAYDSPHTVAGQGTLMMEWEDQGLEADTVLIAVGGGGLIGGALAWLRGRRKVVAVEPENCATLANALNIGPETETAVSGVAANALGARRIGRIAYGLAKDHEAPSVLVTDTAIVEAQKRLWQDYRLLVEPAGACALAALLSGAYVPAPGERVAVLLCGANPAPDPLG